MTVFCKLNKFNRGNNFVVKDKRLLNSCSNCSWLITEKQISVEEKAKVITLPEISQCIVKLFLVSFDNSNY